MSQFDAEDDHQSAPHCNQSVSRLPNSDIATQFFNIQIWLSQQLKRLKFSDPVSMIYDPLDYAGGLYFHFLQRYCRSTKQLFLLGMNPGPWGMGQTGVPFGDVNTVKNYLELESFGHLIHEPFPQHNAKKVLGLKCPRTEQSGAKLWRLIQNLTDNQSAQHALSNLVVHNYCPLIFMKDSGCNLTPDELKASNRKVKEELFSLCNAALNYSLDLVACKYVISIGRFAEKRAHAVIKTFNKPLQVLQIPHPSPRNAASRAHWEENVMGILKTANLLPLFSYCAN